MSDQITREQLEDLRWQIDNWQTSFDPHLMETWKRDVAAKSLKAVTLALRALDLEAQTCDNCAHYGVRAVQFGTGIPHCYELAIYAPADFSCGAWQAKAAPKGDGRIGHSENLTFDGSEYLAKAKGE